MIKFIIWIYGRLLNIGAYLAPRYTAKKGYQLFCKPFPVKLKEKQEAFLKTAELETLTAEDIPDIQVYKWGSGPKKILFLHGWQSHTYRWKYYANALDKSDYTIYSIDGPAHGKSGGKIMNVPKYALVLKRFVDQYGPLDYYAGHSLGGFTILYACYSETIKAAKGLIILGSPGNAQDFVDVYVDALKLNKKAINIITEEFVRLHDVKPDFFTIDEFTKNIKFPGLIIHDKEDKDAPFHYAETLHDKWDQSELFVTEGLGHKLRSPRVVEKFAEYLEREG